MSRSLVLEPLDDTRNETGPIRLTRFPCTIGRSRRCDPRLNLQRISRRHLRVSVEGERIMVEDLGSTNGTFVNDERLSAPATLRPGDHLHIADYAFRVKDAEQAEEPADQHGGAPRTLPGNTIAGFTEDPEGFPVQAPQFYELLNDSLLEPLAVEAVVGEERREAIVVQGQSTHPALNAGHERLTRMARQIGEEARYHGILRERAAETADRAALDNRVIVLPADPVEAEDPSVLLKEFGDIAARHRRLTLACEIDVSAVDPSALSRLSSGLGELGIALAARIDSDETGKACEETGIVRLEVPDDARPGPIDSFY